MVNQIQKNTKEKLKKNIESIINFNFKATLFFTRPTCNATIFSTN